MGYAFQQITRSPNRYGLASLLFVAAIVVNVLLPMQAFAAQLTDRSLTLGTSAAGASTTYTFDFTTATADTFQSFEAQLCDAPSGACSTLGTTTSSTLDSVSGLPGTWAVNNGTAGSLRATVTSGASGVGSSTITQFVFGSVTNSSTANQTVYARIVLFSDTAWATPVDDGVVAASTSEQITLSGSMNESLLFCVGTSITAGCGTISGNSIDFGTFSSGATSFDESVMAASTNAAGGYSVTVNGSTLTCSGCSGTPTISALGSPTGPVTGNSQFGLNLVANATPTVGSDPSGGSGAAATDYDTADDYKFATGNVVAESTGVSAETVYTVSYIVNVPGNLPAGLYDTTLTYICTSTF